MAVDYQYRIVRDGLVLCLDAGNIKSYPGSGTTCFDRSGNGNHGTLAGGVGYSSSNGGIFTFDGVDDNIIAPVNLSNTSHTIIATARYAGPEARRIVSSNNGNWLMGWWNTQTNKYYAEGWVSSDTGGSFESSWITYAVTGNVAQDLYELYRNGVSIVGPNGGGSGGPNGIKLGGWTSSEFSNCQVSNVLAYNRILTATEIQQNFNATRGRFGI